MTLWRIRATVDDRPGYLSVLTASLALRAVNILTVQVHTTEAGAVDDFLVDAPDTLRAEDLIAAVERGRGRDCWVARSEARGLVDQPTRALGLAGRLVRDPDALGEVLRTLLGASAVSWRPGCRPGHRSGPGEAMWLADPAGGMFEIVRDAPTFTPAEYARARALVELAAAVVAQPADRVTLALPDGTELTVRPATREDLPAVREMRARCAERDRRRPGLGEARLRRLLEPTRGVTLLALDGGPAGASERVVALANLVAEGAMAEFAVLVEDAWRRRGVGTALLRRLVAHGRRVGYDALVAHAHVDDLGLRRTLTRLGGPMLVDRDGDLLSVTLPLAPARVGGPAPSPIPAALASAGLTSAARPAMRGRAADPA